MRKLSSTSVALSYDLLELYCRKFLFTANELRGSDDDDDDDGELESSLALGFKFNITIITTIYIYIYKPLVNA